MINRDCRKCKNRIPYRAKIDGKTVSLQNRKFCLTCSPFGGRNTSAIDPDISGKEHKRKYTEARKETIILSLYKRALTRKQELLDDKGGKCQLCGYNKCRRVLSFHHRVPKKKSFGLTLNNMWSKTWKELQKEAKKCDLLCLNCHMEIEDAKNDITDRVNAKYGTSF